MRTVDETLIERGNPVMLRGISSFAADGAIYSTRGHKSRVLSVLEDGRLKLALPEEYGNAVPLPLDRIYEIAVRTEEDVFRGKGKILSRFRSEEGNVCLFQLTGALSADAKKQYRKLTVRIPTRYELDADNKAGAGTVTAFSMDRLVLETTRFLEEKQLIRLSLQEEHFKELRLEGTVRESLKIRRDVYESEIVLRPPDIALQKALAVWFLEQE